MPRTSTTLVPVPRATAGGEPTVTVAAMATELGKAEQMIRNWIISDKLHGERLGEGHGTYLIRVSELRRVEKALGLDTSAEGKDAQGAA
jgi:hypothetical protein